MTKPEYIARQLEYFERQHAITKAKNADYTGDSSSPFANLMAAEQMGITTTEKGILIRLLDKVARLIALSDDREAKVKDESIEDTCLDACNYLHLYMAYRDSKKLKPSKCDPEILKQLPPESER